MEWPKKPTCHDSDYQAKRFGSQSWEYRRPDSRNPDGEPFRRCSYCGSIHPEDLLNALSAGAQLGGSDWKYGWPHKFYVTNIPNENRDRQAEIGSTSYWDEKKGKSVTEPMYGTEGDFHAKWYNQHLQDAGFDDEAREAFLKRLTDASGIEWGVTDGKAWYRAPHAGFQKEERIHDRA